MPREFIVLLSLSLGSGMIGGIVAWLVIEWVGKPIASFLALRRSVIEELHFYANVEEESPPEIREEARHRLRQRNRYAAAEHRHRGNLDVSQIPHIFFSAHQSVRSAVARHAFELFRFQRAVDVMVGEIVRSNQYTKGGACRS